MDNDNDVKMTGAIDLTPTWAGVLPAYIAVLEDGTDEGRRAARKELLRMAKAADRWNKAAELLRPLLVEHAQHSDAALREIAADINREFGFTPKNLPTGVAATLDGASVTAWRKDSEPGAHAAMREGTLNGTPYRFAVVGGDHVWFALAGAWWTVNAPGMGDDHHPVVVLDVYGGDAS